MSFQSKDAAASVQHWRSRLVKFGGSLASLVWSWAFAVWLIAFMELGWTGSPSDILAHARHDPHLAPAAAIAVFIGWNSARRPKTDTPSEGWENKHPLMTQAFVGLAIAAAMLAAYLLPPR